MMNLNGKTLWRAGIGIGSGCILLDRFLHILSYRLAIAVFLIACVLIITGMWKERA